MQLLAHALGSFSPRLRAARARLSAAAKDDRTVAMTRLRNCGVLKSSRPPVSPTYVNCKRLTELSARRLASTPISGIGASERSRIENLGRTAGILMHDDAEIVMRYINSKEKSDNFIHSGSTAKKFSETDASVGMNASTSRVGRACRPSSQGGDGVWCMLCGAMYASLGQARRHVGRVHVPEALEDDAEEESCASIPYSSDSNGVSPPPRDSHVDSPERTKSDSDYTPKRAKLNSASQNSRDAPIVIVLDD